MSIDSKDFSDVRESNNDDIISIYIGTQIVLNHVAKLENKNQLDATYYFTVLLIGPTCFVQYYAHHQDLTTIMLITTFVVSFLVCCRLEVRCG